VFIGTKGKNKHSVPGANSHRMFRAIPNPPYFKEVRACVLCTVRVRGACKRNESNRVCRSCAYLLAYHCLFKKLTRTYAAASTINLPIQIRGPWIKRFDVFCAVAADGELQLEKYFVASAFLSCTKKQCSNFLCFNTVNNDGLDDLILCDKKGHPKMYVQNKAGKFRAIHIPNTSHVKIWRNARVGHVTNGKLPDLVVVDGTGPVRGKKKEIFVPPRLLIFRGINRPPYFNFAVRLTVPKVVVPAIVF